METIFNPARQHKVYEDVVSQIQNAILAGRLKTGDRLPSERSMKICFQTGRNTIREALRVLEYKGFIEICRGKQGGAFVRARSPGQAVAEGLDLLLACGKVSMDQIAEFRGHVEGDIAALAAERAKPSDIRMLNHRLEKIRNSIAHGSSDFENFLAADYRLHMALARITGNPLYAAIIESTHSITGYFERFRTMAPQVMESNWQDLKAIVDAAAGHRPRQASAVARNHVARFNRLKD